MKRGKKDREKEGERLEKKEQTKHPFTYKPCTWKRLLKSSYCPGNTDIETGREREREGVLIQRQARRNRERINRQGGRGREYRQSQAEREEYRQSE